MPSQVETYTTQVNAHLDSIGASVDGVVGDVAALKAKIVELQNTPPVLTPEDQALLDDIQARTEALATKLAALDAETENVPAPPVP